MGKSTPKTPQAPDPVATAAAQSKYNQADFDFMLQQQRANSFSPVGSTTWERTPGANEGDPASWSMNQQFSDQDKSIYDQLTQEMLGNNVTEDAMYQRLRRLQDPQADLDRRALEQRLAERGFQVGNEGYNNEMSRFDNLLDESRLNSANQAVLSGRQLAGNLRSQLLSQLLGQPAQYNTPGMNGVDYAGLEQGRYLGELDSYNSKVASNNSLTGSLLGLGGMALMGPLGGKLFGGAGTGAAGYAGQGLTASGLAPGSFWRM